MGVAGSKRKRGKGGEVNRRVEWGEKTNPFKNPIPAKPSLNEINKGAFVKERNPIADISFPPLLVRCCALWEDTSATDAVQPRHRGWKGRVDAFRAA